MENNGMSAYEQFMVAEKTSRNRAGGVAITGLVLGSVGLAAAIAMGIYTPVYANARAKVAEAKNEGTAALLNQMAALLNTERAERVAQGMTISQTINDTISGQQSASQSQATSVENSAYATAMNQIVSDRLTGRSSLDAQPVCIYSAPKPCNCPGCGCGQ